MKKLVLTAMIVFILPAFAFGYFQMSGQWVEYECEICGKTIYSYQEYQGAYIDNMPSGSSSWTYAPGPQATEFIQTTRHICQECREKYQAQFTQHIQTFFDIKREENIDSFSRYQDERKAKEIQERKDKIDKLQRELKVLQGETGGQAE